MKRKCGKFAAVFFWCFIFAITVTAEETAISGFVDVIYTDAQSENSSFGMGSFEIDFEKQISERAAFEGAVVVEDGKAALGQTLVDFSIVKDKANLQAGLIDIPFGIDYLTFAACDRKLITPPLTTELMMDGGWGDIGINLHGKVSQLNYNFYAVNGMGEDSTHAPVNQMADNNNSKTFGGRAGFSPEEGLEIGLSAARGPYLKNDSEKLWQRTGADIRFESEAFNLKGEYLTGKEDLTGTAENKHKGFYLEVLKPVSNSIYAVVRYGEWQPDGGDKVERITAALGYDIAADISLRGEYAINKETPKEDNNSVKVQVVVNF